LLAALLALGASSARGQDTLRLPDLQAAALRADPRARQLALQAAQSARRLRSIDAERLPALAFEGQSQYQSDVVSLPFQLPGGVRPPGPPHDTYDARLAAQQSIFDPTRTARRAAERAQLAESQAGTQTALFALRQEVNDAFFAAAALDARLGAVQATLVDLEGRRREAAARVREGAALPSDTATLAATILQRQQDVLQLRADRRAALARLATLTDATPSDSAPTALPALATEVAQARAALDSARLRPEFAQFAATRERLDRQSALVAAQERPRVSAFGRAGYGKPGLDFLNRGFDTYWLAGVQVRWAPWTWGTSGRDREVLALQREIVETSEAAFARQLRRGVEGDLATIDRVTDALVLDARIVALRSDVEREARARFGEGVITSADYVAREAELLTARVALAQHRVELAQAQARLLTTLGYEVR
jgi:outer membrane protein TolC